MTYKEHSICIWCKHLKLRSKNSIIPSCSAFPTGIPDEIMPIVGPVTFDHRYPHPNDNGVQFEPKNDVNELMKSVGIRQIIDRYGGDESEIFPALNRIFKEYDDRRKDGSMRPSSEEINNYERDDE